MIQDKKKSPQFAVCINNSEYLASLELYKIYHILPDDDAAVNGDLRVVDESGEDYLYPADFFISMEIPESIENAILQES